MQTSAVLSFFGGHEDSLRSDAFFARYKVDASGIYLWLRQSPDKNGTGVIIFHAYVLESVYFSFVQNSSVH